MKKSESTREIQNPENNHPADSTTPSLTRYSQLSETNLSETPLFIDGSWIVSSLNDADKSYVTDELVRQTVGKGQSVLYLVSNKSLAHLYATELRREIGPQGIRVLDGTDRENQHDSEVMTGHYDIAIMVYEKARLTAMKYPGFLRLFNLVIADHLEVVSDNKRGAGIDALLHLYRERSDTRLIGFVYQEAIAKQIERNHELDLYRFEDISHDLLFGEMDLERGEASWKCQKSGRHGRHLLASGPEHEKSEERRFAEMALSLPRPTAIFAPTRGAARRMTVALEEEIEYKAQQSKNKNESTELPKVTCLTKDLSIQSRKTVEKDIYTSSPDLCILTSRFPLGRTTPLQSVVLLPGMEYRQEQDWESLTGPVVDGEHHPPTVYRVKGQCQEVRRKVDYREGRTLESLLVQACYILSFGDESQTPMSFMNALLSICPGRLCAKKVSDAGADQGLWMLGDNEVALTPLGSFASSGLVEVQVLAGWRTMLRRFHEDSDLAALSFLSIGGAKFLEQVNVSTLEMDRGDWIGLLARVLKEDHSALSRYFRRFLTDIDGHPRRIHAAAKVVLVFLAREEGMSLEDLTGKFQLQEGVIEDLQERVRCHLRTLKDFAAHCQANGIYTALEQILDGKKKLFASLHKDQTVITTPAAIGRKKETRLTIEEHSGTVRVGAESFRLKGKQLQLLLLLARGGNEGVRYGEIHETLWPDHSVQRQALNYHQRSLENAFQEIAKREEDYIETIANWGLRLAFEETLIKVNRVRRSLATARAFKDVSSPRVMNFIARPVMV